MRTVNWVVAGVLGVSGAAGLGVVMTRATNGSCCAPRSANATHATSVVTVQIEGVTCASCAVGIRGALAKLDGVSHVTMEQTSAVVRYDPSRVAPSQIIAAIDKLGFKAHVA